MVFDSKEGRTIHKQIRTDVIRPFEALAAELGYKGRGGWVKLLIRVTEFISENKSLFRK